MSAILRELLRVSEKAAHIARACRQHDALFQLLIEEKKGEDKNKKFALDFKTLADVLVQEVIKRHMEAKVGPGLRAPAPSSSPEGQHRGPNTLHGGLTPLVLTIPFLARSLQKIQESTV